MGVKIGKCEGVFARNGFNSTSFYQNVAQSTHSLFLEEIRQLFYQLFSFCLELFSLELLFSSWITLIPNNTLSPREYFEPEAPERNRIPVVNTNLSSDQVVR